MTFVDQNEICQDECIDSVVFTAAGSIDVSESLGAFRLNSEYGVSPSD